MQTDRTDKANRSRRTPPRIPEIEKSALETGRSKSARQPRFHRSPISGPAKARGIRGSAPHIAKSPKSRNAWLTTRSGETSLRLTKFPANRENNWEYFDIWLFRPKLALKTCAFSVGYEQIPYEPEQGIVFTKLGILSV